MSTTIGGTTSELKRTAWKQGGETTKFLKRLAEREG